MNKIVVIGNGFDLRTNVKSSFKDFIRFITYGVVWHNYSEVLKEKLNFDFKTLVEDKISGIAEKQRQEEKSDHPLEILLEHPDCKNVSAKCRNLLDTMFGSTLFEHILKNSTMLSSLLMKNHNDKRWSIIYGIEEIPKGNTLEAYAAKGELRDIAPSGKGLETIAALVENALDKNSSNIALWSDVETVIEMLITRNPELVTKFNFEKVPDWNNETLKSFSEGVELFECLFADYLSVEQKKAEITDTFFNDIVDNHVESLIQRSHGLLNNDKARKLLNAQTADTLINYNYTDIAERLYNKFCQKESHKLPSIIHINGAISPYNKLNEFPTDIIIGFTNPDKNEVPKDFYPFEKSSRRILKGTKYVDINYLIKKDRLITQSFDLLIIGHSCCMADRDVISKLLEHNKLNNAVILCYGTTALISAFNNIKTMVNPEKFAELMDYKKTKLGSSAHNLFFAIEPPKLNSVTEKQLETSNERTPDL